MIDIGELILIFYIIPFENLDKKAGLLEHKPGKDPAATTARRPDMVRRAVLSSVYSTISKRCKSSATEFS